MNLQVNIDYKEAIPVMVDSVEYFTDKTVYNVAVLTREMTKRLKAFPRLTGKLEQEEIASQVVGSKNEYGLIAGVDYAVQVWNYGENTRWTNENTKPQWYYSIYDENEKTIVNEAVSRALREV